MQKKMKWIWLTGFAVVGLFSSACNAASGSFVLKSKDLKVEVDRAFPRVISYTDRQNGAVLYGQTTPLSEVTLNGKVYSPKVKSSGPGWFSNKKTASYKLVFPEAGNVEMVATLSLRGSVLTFRISEIKDNENFRVGSVAIPDHALISVKSSQPDAMLASATIHADKAKRMDTFTLVTSNPVDLPEQNTYSTSAYAILSTSQLAATLVSNSAYDNPQKNKDAGMDTTLGNGRVCMNIQSAEGEASASLWSGEWTYRPVVSEKVTDRQPPTVDMLWAKVIITRDRNGDGKVDWQDGAVAYRDIMESPFKSELTPTRVAQHISFNFGSQAGEPFLRTLDNLKRVYNATDGLGQFLLLKGYQSEGHDSAHPDYGGNIGRRQGGKNEMNILVDTAHEWNTEVGVHINCQEAYPEAYTFEPDMIFEKRRGWDWIDTSYIMDHRWDITSGALEGRIQHMMQDVPGMDFIYMDVYWGDGWLSQELARILERNGIGITTEFPDRLEHAATWSHWSVDMTYGPDTLRGINSEIIRFIRNHQKDMYLKHPLLGHAELGDFEGWQGRTDFTDFLDKLYTSTLPSKYMQNFEILKWEEHEIQFTGQVRVTDAAGHRQIFRRDRLVLDGDAYLLPWEPKAETKLYHWNAKDGTTTWTLPAAWKSRSVKMYPLTQTGRLSAIDVPVVDGKVTLTAVAKTPYVIYPFEAPALPESNWGEASPVKDPGFYDMAMPNWKVNGAEGVVAIEVDAHQRTALMVGESDQLVSISQTLKGLKPGTYSASVWVEVDVAGRKATLAVAPQGGKAVRVWTDSSLLVNTVKNSHWNRTRTQRMRVLFDVPEGCESSMLILAADPGTSRIRFDDVRVVEAVHVQRSGYDFFEDFENIDEGWFPFVKGPVGGVEDPRTHLSERHSPYTDAGWNGKLINDTLEGDWSLKAHSERMGKDNSPGLIYRTVSQTLRFEPGQKYEVSFDFQCCYDDQYEFIVGVDVDGENKVLKTTAIPAAHETMRFSTVIEPDQKEYWIGMQRVNGDNKANPDSDLVIDNLGVRKLSK